MSCRQSDLDCIGAQRFLFQKSKYNSSTLLFRSLSGGVLQVNPTDTWVADTLGTMAAAANDTSANHVTAVLDRLRPRGVSPAAAAQHVAATSAAGRAHVVAVRTDATYGLRFALDLPLPQQLDCRPWRCHTCGIVFAPTKQDVKKSCPDVLLCESDWSGEVLMTRQFLLHVVGGFYESMNARSVRRSLVEYFTANTWALCGGERGVWFAAAVPRPNLLRRIICLALEQYSLPPYALVLVGTRRMHIGLGHAGPSMLGPTDRAPILVTILVLIPYRVQFFQFELFAHPIFSMT